MTTASQTHAEPPEAAAWPSSVQAAAGVIAAAMANGSGTPQDIAQAEADAGILFDPQRAQDIADAAAEQAHAQDQAEIVERGRQLAAMADVKRRLDAILRLCEGRPGYNALLVSEVLAAAAQGATPVDDIPMTLAWTGQTTVPERLTSAQHAYVHCVTAHAGRAVLALSHEQRLILAGLLDAEVRIVAGPCPTEGCGTVDDYDASDPALSGWARVEVAGVEDGRPRWYCSPRCVVAALARSGDELAAADRAAAAGPAQHGEMPPADVGEDLDARYGVGASDEYALQLAEAAEAGFEDARGDVDEDGAW